MFKLALILVCTLVTACDEIPDETEKLQSSEQDRSTQNNAQSFQVKEVVEGIFVHQGKHVLVGHEQQADIANIGFIIGEKCVAVIDTGGSLAIGEQLLLAIRQQTDLPICFVINTHVHFDHVLGNGAFIDDNPQFIGHVNLAFAMEQNRAFFLENFIVDVTSDNGENLIIPPDTLVEDVLDIDLGQRRLMIKAQSKSHSHTDLTIYDKQTNTLWLSDLLFIERTPSIDGSILGWFSIMESLRDESYARVIPGHGPISAGWPIAMDAQQQYFQVLIDETREAIAKGMFIGDAVNSIAQSEKKNWVLFDSANQRAVSRVYRELEWE